MRISAINPIRYNYPNKINYRGNVITRDFFDRNRINKYVKIKDMQDREFYAVITKEKPRIHYRHNAVEYVMKRGEENLGYAIALNYGQYDGMFLSDLFTSENSLRQYKGCGTELLKCVAQESKNRGFEGAILCCAYHPSESPIMFYFKNNFTTCSDYDSSVTIRPTLFNAPLQYIAKNNKNMHDILPFYYDLSYMELSKENSKALLEGKQLYKERICDEIAKTDINGQTYSAQYIYFPDCDKRYLQVLNETSEDNKLSLILELMYYKGSLKIVGLENHFLYYSPMVYDFAKSLINDVANKYL